MEEVARNLAFCWANVRERAENRLACSTGADIVALALNPARKVRAVEPRSQTFVVLLLV